MRLVLAAAVCERGRGAESSPWYRRCHVAILATHGEMDNLSLLLDPEASWHCPEVSDGE